MRPTGFDAECRLAGQRRRISADWRLVSENLLSGTIRSRWGAATYIPAAPLGAQHHLWKFPVQKSGPREEMSTSTIPGAWAASTNDRTPARPNRRTMSATGKTIAVGEAMCSTTARRVRPVTPCTKASASWPGPSRGSGTGCTTTSASASSQACSAASRIAP